MAVIRMVGIQKTQAECVLRQNNGVKGAVGLLMLAVSHRIHNENEIMNTRFLIIFTVYALTWLLGSRMVKAVDL